MTEHLRREEIARPLSAEEEATARAALSHFSNEPNARLVARLLATLDAARSQDTATARIAAPLEVLRRLDDKHFPTTRAKRPDWEVCDHDSMTWPCDTQRALDAFETHYAALRQALDDLDPNDAHDLNLRLLIRDIETLLKGQPLARAVLSGETRTGGEPA